ncbi:arrestin domain-containing protein 3-like [Daphnia carinata]|uniref:arrestin domain-containing protein 3-like n=1 Tax=Daphnia carinata TaxID=120202 RepID=UPI00257AD8B4|nr:arrestin domain-containing protein 3-like [Daphnia carinata]
MGFERFEIVLENRNGIFYPGQTIIGVVHVSNAKSETIRGIQVDCSGVAEVRIPGKDAKNTYNSTGCDFYCAREQYFDFKFSLVNPGQHAVELAAGHHQYPFTFVLPTQIPPSFEGPYGHIRYNIQAVAQRTWLKREYVCNSNLTVNAIVDLNTMPKTELPVKKIKSKTLGLLCCKSAPISAQAQIERAGYVPGETIILHAHTDNESGISMRGSKAQLVQITKFIAEGQTNCESKVLKAYIHESFIETDVMDNVKFVVPQVPPSTLPFCGIMDISYQVQYIVDPGTLSINVTINLDLVIGTIPLRSHTVPSTTTVSNNSVPILDHWTIPDVRGSEWVRPSAPPPSYEEIVQVGDAR